MKSCVHTGRVLASLLFVFSGLFIGQVSAQTTLISPTGDGGFENGTTFPANGWTLVNGAANQWFIGPLAVPSAGTNSAYISDNAAGTTYTYNAVTSVASTVHFYRDITFPAGESSITLSFKWKCNGEGSYDYVSVFSIPTSVTPVVNSPAGAFQSWLNIPTAYPGATILCTPPNLNLQTVYQTQTVCLPPSFAGTTQRIVFMWSNDGSVNNQPPGSIDEISLVSAPPPPTPANQPTALALTPTASSIAGSFTAAASAPSGYLVVRTTTNVPPAAPVTGTTYTAGQSALGGVIVSSGATTTFTSTGLTPSTPYFFWVYSFNGPGVCGGPSYRTASPLTASATTTACSISGTRSVGPTGFYSSLTAAITDINLNGLAGPLILELQSTYVSTAEPAFPVVLPAILCGSATNNVTIRPATGATALSISGTNTTGPILDINGGNWWRIDGRPGGVGPSKELTISNLSTTGDAIRFINEGSNNIVRFCTLAGVSTSTVDGVVLFSTTTGLNGNDNNLIDNCDIRDGASKPANGIFSSGSTTFTPSSFNSNNTISNCNIFNFSASTTWGINLSSGNREWTITGNSLYQTASTTVSGTFGGIQVSSTTSGPFTISNNFIGGTAPNCGGTALTLLSSTPIFRGMNINTPSGTVSTISGNTIANVNFTTTSTSTLHNGIFVGTGSFDITGNTIGSTTVAGSITMSYASTTQNTYVGISGSSSLPNVINMSGNTIGGHTFLATSTQGTSLRGMWLQGTANYNITNNTIGGTLANSLNLNGNNSVIGMLVGGTNVTITGNAISNLSFTGTAATGAVVSGILGGPTATYTVSNNTISRLSNASANVGTGSSAAINGISVGGTTTGGTLVSQNTISELNCTAATTSMSMNGISVTSTSTTGTNIVERNLIHSFSNISTGTAVVFNGLLASSATNFTYRNNMIRLGIDASAASVASDCQINGINELAGTNNFYHNSVYLGGTVATAANNTFAFNSAVTANARNFSNNIFFNARSSTAGVGKNYAIQVGGTSANPAGLNSNYNLLLANGTAGVIGRFNAVDQATLADWRTATGQDLNSISADPRFASPTSATPDLHISAVLATPVEGGGQSNASVTDDYDGQSRAGLSPVDIGADAGNFVAMDISGPGISYTPVTAGCGTGNIALTGVTITDATGVPLAGSLVPRIYFRKAAGAWFSRPGTLASGTATNGIWNFNIVVADVGGVAAGDVISYYVIAQDNAATPNIGSNPGGVVATDVNTVTTHPALPNTLTVLVPLAGTYSVGPAGNYPTLTAAANAVLMSGVSAPVIFELNAAYTSATEVLPIVLGATTACGNSLTATNTVTIRPAAGAPILTISGANATGATIDFNGGNWWRIDGRPGGTGTTRGLIISNTNVANPSIRYINGASNNIVQYCEVQGANTSTTSGVILFSTTTTPNGNNNNLIDNCDVHDLVGLTPTNLVYANGTATNYSTQNNNNTISNSLLHDWFNATSTVAGAAINVIGGCSDWTITGNSFYQTAARTFSMTTATDQGAIFINSVAFGFNFTITNNFIGGSAPLCAGVPLTWTGGTTGTPTPRFIRFSTSTGLPFSNISNNTIANISVTTSSTSTASGLITHLNGNVNIDNNTLGSQTATGNIVFVLASTSTVPFFLPIAYGTGATVSTINVTNNNLGGISVSTSSTGSVSFRIVYGQPVAQSRVNVSNNTIGGTVANSIQQLTNGITPAIMILNPTVDDIVSNNTIRNITHNNAGVTGSLTGINVQASGGRHTITGNTISDLTSNSTNAAINNAASVVGLTMTGSAVGGTNVSGNTIFNLTNTNTTVAGWINGMYFGTAAAPAQNTTIARNFVHSINLASATGGMAGIFLPNAGNALVYNNMVRLGIDNTGAPITNSLQINGMFKAATGSMGIYFNTVYIGGTGVASGAVNSFAFRRSSSGPADTVMNNIFYNARSNASGTGKHYAINLNANTNILCNNNDLLADGTGGVLGLLVAADFATLPAWQAGANLDWNSASSDPKLVNPAGNTATLDLHIQPASATPVERSGYNIPLVTTDFDGQARAGLTPVDMGADAGNFTLMDLAAPAIYYTPFINTTCGTGDRTLAGVNITDATGVPLSGALRPRIYYKKNAGAFFSQAGTFVSGTANNSIWNFNIVAADMGGLVAGDVVSYYIIAQDVVGTPNIGSNPAGVVATDVNTVTTAPVNLNTYTINGTSLSGTYTVGTGGNYASLTAAVAAYNTACLSGAVVFSLTDALYSGNETFPITINANPFASATNTLTIKTTLAGTSISGSSATGLIVLNGADYVTIDGSISATANTVCPPSAASRNLTITNTNTGTASAVIWLQSTAALDAATNNTIKNINVEGSGNTQTLFGIGSGSATISLTSLGAANNNNSIINNNISKTQYGIYSQGANLSAKNTGSVINQNLINTAAPNNVARGGILLGFEDNILVSGNNISGILFNTTPDVFGITLGLTAISTTGFVGNEVTNATVSNNLIGSVVNTGTFSASGIAIANALTGTNTIANNMISGVFANGTSTDFASGIFAGGGPNSITRIYHNTVSMSGSVITTGSQSNYALAIGGVQPNVDVRNNIFTSTGNSGTGLNVGIGLAYPGTTGNYQNLISNNNDIFVTGAGAAVGVTGALTNGTGIARTTLANWQAETGRDQNSFSVQPSFVSLTDLHLTASANQCLNGRGASLALVTNDIDCQVRNASTPDIGADEFNTDLNIAVTETSGAANNDGIICAGASATLTATGGGTYSWNTGVTTAAITVTPAATTTYTVTITSNGCSDVLTTTITVNPIPTPSISAAETSGTANNDGIICTGASAILTATAGGTYAWSTGANTASITVAPTGTTTYVVTVTNTGCSATASFTVTVNGLPTPGTSVAETSGLANNDGIICTGASATITATGGTSYLWSPGGATTAAITVNPTMTTTYIVTVTNANNCSATATRVITVNALPTPGITPAAPAICVGGSTTLTANGGTSYVWSPGGATTAAISVNPAVTTTYTVTATNANGCSNTVTAVVTVNPLPVLTFTKVEPTTCVATNGSIDLSVGGTGTFTYNWSGSGIVQGQQDQSNLGVGTYQVTVTNSGTGCTSTLVIGLAGPGGCSVCPTIGTLTATPTVCNGSAASLTASGLADMGVTYGIEFKYSTTAVDPYTGGTSIGIIPNNALGGGGTTATTTFTFPTTGTYFVYAILNPVATDPTCRPSKSATVTVNPVPSVNAVANKTNCVGTTVPATVFSSSTTGTVFTWSRTGEAIGLAATSGTGNVPAFTATNTGTAPLTSTFTVVPSFTANGVTCTGTSIQFTITVNPTPTIDQPASQVVCNNSTTAAVPLTGSVPGTVFTWVNNNTSIGLGASGTGNIAAFNAVNTGTTPVVATITVSASYTNNGVTCPDGTRTFTITVNPTPTVNAVSSQVRCNGTATAAVSFSGAVTGTVYNWTNNAPGIGLAASGTGNIASFTAVNTGNAPVVATITVTPSYTNGGTTCTGSAITFTITVNPTPVVNPVANQVVCSGSSTAAVVFGSNVAGTTFTWTNNNTSIGLAASGSGDIASFTAVNATLVPVVATITVTPSFTGTAVTCTGSSITFTITVNPTPTVNQPANQLVCSESSTAAVTFTGTVTGTVFNWTNNTPAIGLAASGSGNISAFIAQNPGTTPLVATITVTPVYTVGGTSCPGTARTFTITVNPLPKVDVGADVVICQDQVANLTAALGGGATGGTWSGGTGTFSDKFSAVTTYTPATSEYGQTITLTFTSNDPAGPCPAVSDALLLTVNTLPIVSAGEDFAICKNTNLTISLLGATITANGSGVTTGTWATSGTGVFQPTNAFPGATTYVPSAADFAAGYVNLTLTSADPAGPCGSVFDVVRLSFHQEKVLVCNDHVFVSLEDDCVSEVLPDDVLEGDFDFDKFYKVALFTKPFNTPLPSGNVVGTSDLGKTYKVRVTDNCTGNYCWGEVTIEDKLPPVVACQDVTITCAITNYTPGYLTGTLGLAAGTPVVTDCSAVTSSYEDTWTDLACGASINGKNNVSAYIRRDWIFTDAFNNFSVCTQYIYLERRSITAVKFPIDIELNCGSASTDPVTTGAPYLTDFGKNWPMFPDQAACELSVGYADQQLPVCGNSYKILRTWTVYDWCLPTNPGPTGTLNPRYFIQVIKVVDKQGPVMACPSNLTVSTGPFTCCSNADLPDIILSDACNYVAKVFARVEGFDPLTNVPFSYDIASSLTTFPGNNLWTPDTLASVGTTPCLPIGQYTVRYNAEDLCGNTASCSFSLTVDDGTPPYPACDEFTQVALGADGMAFVNASTFDDGSYDNCGVVNFKARRMASNDCQSNDSFYDQVKFCCDDIGDTIQVILRVYDVDVPTGDVSTTFEELNANTCMVRVFVEDKIKPICPAMGQVTVTCENFDPSLWAYGKPQIADNCCLDTSVVYQEQIGLTHSANYSQFDTLCSRGTITRTFRAIDCSGNSAQCTQRVLVTYEQDYFVRFPDDRIVTVCDGTGNYGEPTFLNKDCELLGVSYTDEVFTVVPDACFKIERTWHIINWCSYNANLGLTVVPNPNPNATVNAPANNTGPVVSSSSNPNVIPAPWTASRVSVTPGAVQTDYSTYWSLTTNGYSYKQIIKIIDQQKPKVDSCPSSPVTICDVTTNAGDLWNATYWWDNTTMSHDLCEGPSDLTVTASDACSGALVTIKYLLFLDLDNNGTMETAISSSNPPGYGEVNFGNASNPNFGGGVPQVFDNRSVPLNEKYGFVLQTSESGNKKTGSVRWSTLKSPTSYFVPELPYGTHKIKWIVEDGCGNETVCEYTFVVKDCKKPTVVCLNGLSVNIMPTKMIQLWASDFLKYTEDNCTPPSKLKIAIRRVGAADGQGNVTGFPRNADGTPQTSVTFTCSDLGEQQVELWSLDLAGNADYCQTYVLVQDNSGNCGSDGATVAGVLETEWLQGLEDATVEVSTGSVVKTDLTDKFGAYEVKKVPFGVDATVTPVKDDNPLNGVSTYDLVLISKHILGLEPLNSPYKMIAADANKSGSITTFDVVELRKLILGIYTELPNNTSWRFVDKSFAFADNSNPFKSAFPENKSLANVQSDALGEDFVAMKIGDVNGSAVANALMSAEDRSSGTMYLEVSDRSVKAGESFEVSFKASDRALGYQLTLGLSGLTVAGVVAGEGVSEDNFGVFADALTVSVDGSASFTVRFRASRSGQLSEMLNVSSRVTRAEAYSLDGSREEVALRFHSAAGSTTKGVGFELYQNEPNPFVSKTFVGFHLPSAASAVLTVRDETGRVLFVTKGDFAKGYNKVSLDREMLPSSGVLYYTLETSTDHATKKMIQVK